MGGALLLLGLRASFAPPATVVRASERPSPWRQRRLRGRGAARGWSEEAAGRDPEPRAATDLERSLKFLQEQYAETLQKLHEEIDLLKRQNKDLHYKLIMNPILQRKGTALDADVCDRMTSPIPFSSGQSRAGDVKIPAASSNPFLVTVLPSYMRKPPTLEECEVVIRQLWNINHMQMQEVRLLALLGPTKEVTRLPKVKNGPKKCRILTPLPAAERAVLPALKQTLGNAFAERQKRTQAVQRNRLHRTAL
uniref:Coiled-coil domain containing 74B n=1 Tax=Podarcis muralis TaxID=64176 RepID=A0A670JR14_PODMU